MVAVAAVLSTVTVTPAAGAISHQRSALILAAVGDVTSVAMPLVVLDTWLRLVVMSPPIRRLVEVPSRLDGIVTVCGGDSAGVVVSAGISSTPVSESGPAGTVCPQVC